LTLLLRLDFLMDLGDLVATAANLLGFVTRVQYHVLVESLFKALLLGHELLGLLLVLGQAVVQRVDLWLVLDANTFNG